jgi:hypothetical protein
MSLDRTDRVLNQITSQMEQAMMAYLEAHDDDDDDDD